MNEQLTIGRHVVAIELAGEWQGQGVVVPDDIVLTAAHCLPAPGGSCFLAEGLHVRVRTPAGRIGFMQAVFVDAVSDIAALVPTDDDPFFLDGIDPIEVSMEWSKSLVFEERSPTPGWFYAHDAGEVAMEWREINAGTAVLTPTRRIYGGTSGGPIVECTGRLIGIIANSWYSNRPSNAEGDPHDVGDETSQFRLLGAAIPPWLAARIESGQSEQSS